MTSLRAQVFNKPFCHVLEGEGKCERNSTAERNESKAKDKGKKSIHELLADDCDKWKRSKKEKLKPLRLHQLVSRLYNVQAMIG